MEKPSVALLVNFVAPSRIRLYSYLASAFDLTILQGAVESNRTSWTEVKVEGAQVRRVAGWQLSLPRHAAGKQFDKWYLHIEPGYFLELLRGRPEAVITFEMGFRTMAGLIYGSLFRKPVWIWWGGTLRTERHIGRIKRLLRSLLARWAKRWISYGQTSTEYLLSLGIPRERILQIQNCVDESWYGQALEPALRLSPRPVLLHAGQMIGRKGVAEFLRAAARIQQEGSRFSIVLVGGGPDLAALQQLVKTLRLEHVHFYPPQPALKMPAFYRSADALIFPTLEDVWGLVANEALLSGLPVLCSRYAGCAPELFDQEALFDPEDEQNFGAALRRVVAGQLPRPDPSRLQRTDEVGDKIVKAVAASIRRAGPAADRCQMSCYPPAGSGRGS